MKFLIINGPNLNLLGRRDARQYGSLTLEEITSFTDEKIGNSHKLEWFQSNLEGEIVNKIQSALSGDYNGLVINPGGYSHTSVAIRDALDLLKIPKVEVHLSQLYNREEFRQQLITAGAVDSVIVGTGKISYYLALEFLLNGEF